MAFPPPLLDLAGPARRALAVLAEHPGATAALVARCMDVRHSTATYHLRRLERRGAVATVAAGRRRHYFVNGREAPGQQMRAVAVLGGRGSLVLERLRGEPQRLGAIACGLPMSKAGAYWHLCRLVGLGLVVADGPPGDRTYGLAASALAAPPSSPALPAAA